jgi:hypothetical protein
MGGIGTDVGGGIAVDGTGAVAVTGVFGSASNVNQHNDFDPGTGVVRLANNGNDDIFVARLAPNADGSMKLSWARDIGGPNADWARGVAVDGAGNVYTTGSFIGPVDFDPGSGTYVIAGYGGRDIFVSKLTASGNFAAAAALGGSMNDDGVAIAVDGSGNVYTTGGFRGTADFDPGSGTNNLTVNGGSTSPFFDAFLSKLAQVPPQITISDVTAREGRSGTTLFVFTVSLSDPSDQAVTVHFSTADGTAISSGTGADYQAQSGTLTFAPGETTKTITIVVNGDRTKEADETFFVNLSDAVGATVLDGQGLGTIQNDD